MSTVLRLIELRSGTTADVVKVDTLMAAAFDPAFGEAWTRGQCLGMMAMPGVWLTIAEVDGDAGGFALSRRILDEAELLLLATAPGLRRQGIASTLLRSVLADAKTQGVGMIHLEVREGNEAIQLYRTAGFKRVGERPNYYRGNAGRAFNAFTYQKDL